MLSDEPQYRRVLPDGRVLDVWPLTFGRSCLQIGPEVDGMFYDDSWIYDSPTAAVAAAATWDGQGEPEGWMRHPASGRRRPDGDPGREYVNP